MGIIENPPSATADLHAAVVAACRTVHDPEIPINIYDLGLIYSIDVSDDGMVDIEMTLTSPTCPVAGEMPGWVAEAVNEVPGACVRKVALVWDPAWSIEMLSEEAQLELGLI